MATIRSDPPSIVCAENIAALSVLHTVPLPLTTNDMDPSLEETAGMSIPHVLSIDEERRLVGALSFLAGISDDANNVAAVCIQEVGQATADKYLRLLIAVNQATTKKNVILVQQLKAGFSRVLSPLADIGLHDPGCAASALQDRKDAKDIQCVEDKVLLAITRMCEQRILLRLRLVARDQKCPGGKRQRPPFKGLLSKVADSLKAMASKGQGQSSLCRIIEEVRTVSSLFSDLTGHRVIEKIKSLVIGMSRLSRLPAFRDTICALVDAELCPTLLESFVNIVTKMARYHEVACLLCRMAAQKELVLIRRWTVIHAELPPTAFQKPDGPQRTPDLASTLADACGRNKPWPPSECKAIFSYLENKNENLTETFQRQAQNSRKKSRIHAEIQLVAYCELRRNLPQAVGETTPRVVRSHKAACYLCNLFITECFRKTYFTSRSHGRLYPGWRLPQCFSGDVAARFNDVLARTIKASVDQVKTRKQKTNYPCPMESVLSLLPYIPSLPDLLVAEAEAEAEAVAEAVAEEGTDAEAVEVEVEVADTTTAPVADVPADNVADTESAHLNKHEDGHQDEVVDIAVPSIKDVQHTSDQASHTSLLIQPEAETAERPPTRSGGSPGSLRLSLDDLICDKYVKVNDATASLLYRIGNLELQVEYDRQENKSDLYFATEQLSQAQVERLGMDEQLGLTDIESLAAGGEAKVSVNDQGCLYLAVDGSVYQVSFAFR